jgi:hypothetical protein
VDEVTTPESMQIGETQAVAWLNENQILFTKGLGNLWQVDKRGGLPENTGMAADGLVS